MPPVIRLRFHAKYWGAWFTPIGKGNVKQTNLNIFYHLGAALEDIQKITPEMTAGDAWIHLMRPHDYTLHFLLETEDLNLPESRAAARRLNAAINQFVDFSKFGNLDAARKLTRDEWYLITQRKEYFENCFDREYRYLDVFTVTPKGIYDTRLLMAKPEEKFPARVRSGLPSQTVADLKQAALCKLTTTLARTYGTVVVEDLNVAGMLRNPKLARHLASASFGEIRRQLAYKTGWNGGRLVVADRWSPSSKTCSACQTVKTKLSLSVRVFTCEHCGLVLDPDVDRK